ncbi:hypothetical protein [Mycobacterium sp. Aquia_213]|uniref:hypothetical protein n=1 Tax=Mycobacterium sp. Aquia_213 TaxID=2991728 RepID=UPI00226DCFDB|nr:hypothetical protein [Mycobacterium sp. Aquia_213]WAC90668.1 hypothetical protein LMQ14_22625 [Mycobacterium sp. Aquia_213]
MSYPQQWPPPQPPQYPQQWPPPPYPPPGPYPPPAPRKTNRVLIIVLALAATVALIPAAIVGFFVIRDIARDGLDGRGGTRKASSLSEFDVVCDRGSISNAAAYAKPYQIAAFTPDDRPSPMSQVSKDHWSELTLDSRADYRVSPGDFQSVNVVACLTHKAGTEVKSRTCDFKTDDGDHVTVDYYAVQYDIELREARTGKHIEQLGAVDGPAASCPFLIWVNKRDRKVYAEPDHAAVDAKLAEFAHR